MCTCLHDERSILSSDFKTDMRLLFRCADDGEKSRSVPYSGKPTEFSKGEISRPTSSIRPARLGTTPFSHVFQPRLPAMSSDVPFGLRTLCLCHSNVSRQQTTVEHFDTDLIDDVIDKIEGLITDVQLHIANYRPGMNTSISKRLKTLHR